MFEALLLLINAVTKGRPGDYFNLKIKKKTENGLSYKKAIKLRCI